MPTLGEIVGRVQELAPRDVSGRLQQDLLLIREWVLGRYRQAVERWHWSTLLTSGSLTTSNGVQSYSLPPDFYRPISFYNSTIPYRLIPKPADWVDTNDPQRFYRGVPRFYSIYGSNVELWPIPDAAYTINFRYVKKPPDPQVSSDQIPLPSAEALVFGTLADCYVYLGGILNRPTMLEQARAFESKWEELLQSSIEADRARVIEPVYPDESSENVAPWLDADSLRKFDIWVP